MPFNARKRSIFGWFVGPVSSNYQIQGHISMMEAGRMFPRVQKHILALT